jgi:hypothetical protein
MTITLSTNALCNAAFRNSVLVRVVSPAGQHLCDVGPARLRDPDVEATAVDRECNVVSVKPISLAGQLFLSLLKEGT